MVGEYMSSDLYWINKIVKKMQWENPMEKLTRLLNEYEDIKGKMYWINNYKWSYDEDINLLCAERVDGSKLGEEESWAVIICRGYCFVKWLVDNDKVDLDKYPQVLEYSDLQSLLMILSIDDSPVEFLASILK